MYMFVLVILILILILIIAAATLYSPVDSDLETDPNPELKNIQTLMIRDAYLHRLLLIEIITEKSNHDQPLNHAATFNKMTTNMQTLSKSLSYSVGHVIANRIVTLMQNRNDLLRQYYISIQHVICNEGVCTHKLNPPTSTTDSWKLLDMGSVTQKQLEQISREITTTITAPFQLRSSEPINHHERLFNLLTMYDKELINQARLYISRQYDISMNCSQSSLDIADHISDEFNLILRESSSILGR